MKPNPVTLNYKEQVWSYEYQSHLFFFLIQIREHSHNSCSSVLLFWTMHTVISLRREDLRGDESLVVYANESGVLCGNLAGTFTSPTFEIILIVQVRIPVAKPYT